MSVQIYDYFTLLYVNVCSRRRCDLFAKLLWTLVYDFSEKDQHAKHLQDLEDDMETQMQKTIERVRSQVTLTLTLTPI